MFMLKTGLCVLQLWPNQGYARACFVLIEYCSELLAYGSLLLACALLL